MQASEFSSKVLGDPTRRLAMDWRDLNGTWYFESDEYQGEIKVPFAWSSRASGVNLPWLERAVYSRRIEIPIDWDQVVMICFSRVHYSCVISLNGTQIGEHEGGYSQFAIMVPNDLLTEERLDLKVEVFAPRDKRYIPHGKQRTIPRSDFDGVCFTPTSGIWGDVWLEHRSSTHFSSISALCVGKDELDIEGEIFNPPKDGQLQFSIIGAEIRSVLDAEIRDDGTFKTRVEAKGIEPWSPENPKLYDVVLNINDGSRCVATAALRTGFRTITFNTHGVFINGERYFLKGVLDQNYWPDSGLTPPTSDALLRDLELAAECGFSLVRKHLVTPDPRWLARADELGILVWEEPPGPSRFSERSFERFRDLSLEMVCNDQHHPSVIIWGLYNEEWGLDWNIPGSRERDQAARRIYSEVKRIDATRPIVENSGWNHVSTDLLDWHYYEDDPGAWQKNLRSMVSQETATFPVKLADDFVVPKFLAADKDVLREDIPFMNSEYGSGFTSVERGWHLRWQTQELRRHQQISGYVYTELVDVEHEMAGIYDVNRKLKDLGGTNPKFINSDIYIIFDLIPLQAGVDIDLNEVPDALGVLLDSRSSTDISGTLFAGWSKAGAGVELFMDNEDFTQQIECELPAFSQLSARVRLEGSALEGGRFNLAFVSKEGECLAWSFLDIADFEGWNRAVLPAQTIDDLSIW